MNSVNAARTSQDSRSDQRPHQLVQDFVAALRKAEETKDVHDLLTLFSDDVILASVGRATALQGHDGAEKFWSAYLDQFETIESRFLNVIEGEGQAVLEWVSLGRSRAGHALEYHGVSILSHDGRRIQSFRTYFDTAVFLHKGSSRRSA